MTDKKNEKAEEAPKKVAAKMFSDVKRPEETVAQATSKPVIVGHTNIIQDPMMSKTEISVHEEPAETPIEKPKHELKLQPLVAQESEAIDTEVPEEISIPKDQEKESDEVTEELGVEENSNDEVENSDTSTGAVDAIVDTINTKKERDDNTEKQQVVDNEVNDLINSRQYNVKIRSAPNKRKVRMLTILLVLGLLAGAVWYFGVGQGKDLWLNKNPETSQPLVTNSTQTDTAAKKTDTTPQLLAFTNPTIKTTFSYPNSWKNDVAKDTEHPTVDVITLSSPVEEIDFVTKNSASVKTEVFMRTKIFVENTKNVKEYASDLTKLTTCTSEDIIVGSSNLKLLFVDSSDQSPAVSQLSLSPDVCSPSGSLFNANDQLQLSTKQNTYVVYTEFVFSNAYLEKNGTKTPEAIKLAQESGITTSKESFKSAKAYADFIQIIKSLKEL